MHTPRERLTRSVDEQIGALRPTIPFAAGMHRWFLASAAVGVVLAILLRNPAPLIVALFLTIIGIAERKTGTNLVAAVRAYDAGSPEPGSVRIRISTGDAMDHYHATIRGGVHSAWHYDFVPQGWQPVAGDYAARVWRAGPEGRPVLAVVERGILIPRSVPRRDDL